MEMVGEIDRGLVSEHESRPEDQMRQFLVLGQGLKLGP